MCRTTVFLTLVRPLYQQNTYDVTTDNKSVMMEVTHDAGALMCICKEPLWKNFWNMVTDPPACDDEWFLQYVAKGCIGVYMAIEHVPDVLDMHSKAGLASTNTICSAGRDSPHADIAFWCHHDQEPWTTKESFTMFRRLAADIFSRPQEKPLWLNPSAILRVYVMKPPLICLDSVTGTVMNMGEDGYYDPQRDGLLAFDRFGHTATYVAGTWTTETPWCTIASQLVKDALSSTTHPGISLYAPITSVSFENWCFYKYNCTVIQCSLYDLVTQSRMHMVAPECMRMLARMTLDGLAYTTDKNIVCFPVAYSGRGSDLEYDKDDLICHATMSKCLLGEDFRTSTNTGSAYNDHGAYTLYAASSKTMNHIAKFMGFNRYWADVLSVAAPLFDSNGQLAACITLQAHIVSGKLDARSELPRALSACVQCEMCPKYAASVIESSVAHLDAVMTLIDADRTTGEDIFAMRACTELCCTALLRSHIMSAGALSYFNKSLIRLVSMWSDWCVVQSRTEFSTLSSACLLHACVGVASILKTLHDVRLDQLKNTFVTNMRILQESLIKVMYVISRRRLQPNTLDVPAWTQLFFSCTRDANKPYHIKDVCEYLQAIAS